MKKIVDKLDYKSLYNKYTIDTTVTSINITISDVEILLKHSDNSTCINDNIPFGMYI